jgi:hypothetical protein
MKKIDKSNQLVIFKLNMDRDWYHENCVNCPNLVSVDRTVIEFTPIDSVPDETLFGYKIEVSDFDECENCNRDCENVDW